MSATALAHRPGPIAHGAFSVPRTAERDYDVATAYLARDPGMRDIIDRAQHASRPLSLALIHDGNDRFDPATRRVYWDPHSALRLADGTTQSPALGLGHELDHATVDPAVRMRGAFHFDAAYDNGEERRVILGSERAAARTLGEGIRHDHGGTPFAVTSPIGR